MLVYHKNPIFGFLSIVLAIHLTFLRPGLERSRRVSMKVFIFSLDGKNLFKPSL